MPIRLSLSLSLLKRKANKDRCPPQVGLVPILPSLSWWKEQGKGSPSISDFASVPEYSPP